LPLSAICICAPRGAQPPLVGARRPPLSIDIFCRHGALQQTRRSGVLRARAYSKEFFGVHNFKSSCMM